ncbi:putative lactoylglutathione lyase [Rhodococcus sp. LBL1]|nr:putative lactoylglutathione lyase [Rhodococcus sp. LBL1]MDH6684515.1 putative lactoylglutathione lyase [Rhodococcus sp. LBL2]
MTTVQSLTLEVPDPAAAAAFYAALGVGKYVDVRAAQEPTTGFRGYTLSLVVSQPNIVDAFVETALGGGAATVKSPKKSLWGYGGVVQAPDGALWKVATSSKKNTGPTVLEFDDLVLLLGVSDVKATKQFYVDHGLEVAKSFGRKYVEFANPATKVKLALYGRRALAKDAGVPEDGTGSHRIVIGSDTGPFTDPDGFAWETAHA